jgi:PAS domain S-box-containing protein
MTNVDKSTEQVTAEAEVERFRAGLGPFIVAVETTRMAMVFTDAKKPDNPIIFANDSFLALTGYSREKVLGQSFDLLLRCGTASGAPAKAQNTFESNFDGSPEVRYRRENGTVFWVSLFVCPVSDENGLVVQHFVSFMDLTAHKQETSRLQFLLDELNHRTRNMLATVQAIAGQTLHGTGDDGPANDFDSRIMALAGAHALLGHVNWNSVSLRDVVDQILRPFDNQASRFSIRNDGKSVFLHPKATLTFAMMFNELATNAVKHGALSNDSGRIDIRWDTETTREGDRMRLRWQESGGPPVTPPSHKGFGLLLLEEGLAEDMEGEVRFDYDPEGMVYQVVMPLPGRHDA